MLMESTQWSLAAQNVAIRLQRFETPIGLMVSEVAVEGTDAYYDSEKKSFRIGKPAEFAAVIDEKDLETFILDQAPAGVDIESIKLEPGYIVAKASVNMLIKISGTAKCVLEIEDGKRVNVRAESVDVLGGSMLATVQKQLNELNPVLDVGDLPIDVRLKTIQIEKGKIQIEGTLAPK